MKLDVTIFIFSFNHQEFILECIESIFKQLTKYKFEVILLDDCSTDSTIKIVKNSKYKVRIIQSPKNTGAPRKLIKKLNLTCNSNFFQFIDGDDYFSNELKIEKQLDYLYKNKKLIGCCHHSDLIKDNNLIGKIEPNFNNKLITIKDYFIQDNLYAHTSSWVWKNINDNKLLPYKFTEKNLSGDFLWSLSNIIHGKVGCINESLTVYRIHDQGMWTKKNSILKKIIVLFIQQYQMHNLTDLKYLNIHDIPRYKKYLILIVYKITTFLGINYNTK